MKSFLCIAIALLGIQITYGQEPWDSLQLQRNYQQANQMIASYQFDRALDLLSTCYIQEPQNIDFLLKIAYCHTQSGRFPDAKLFYREALKVDSLNLIAMSSLGGIFERELNYRKAQDYFLQLIEIDTTNSYYFKRNGFLALRLNNPIGAIQYFLKAHELNKADIEVIHQIGSIYLALEQLEFAERMITKGLHTDPNNIKLLQTKARIHHKKKEHELVPPPIEKTMAQGDTSDYYQMMLAVSYIHIDSVDTAIYHLNRIVAREKDSEHTHHYLGLAYRTKGEIEKAEEHFKKAIELGISQQMGEYYAGLASTLEDKGDIREAIKQYEKAREYGSGGETIFHLARNCDLYYKDKKIALRYYQEYLNTRDNKYKEYAQQRIPQLKEIIHFQN